MRYLISVKSINTFKEELISKSLSVVIHVEVPEINLLGVESDYSINELSSLNSVYRVEEDSEMTLM